MVSIITRSMCLCTVLSCLYTYNLTVVIFCIMILIIITMILLLKQIYPFESTLPGQMNSS